MSGLLIYLNLIAEYRLNFVITTICQFGTGFEFSHDVPEPTSADSIINPGWKKNLNSKDTIIMSNVKNVEYGLEKIFEGAQDFLPLLGTDYIEFYVGNAKQAAYFYKSAFGFHS